MVTLLAQAFVRGAWEADGDPAVYSSQNQHNIRTTAGHCGESPAGVAGVARISEVQLGFPPCSGSFGLTSPLVPGSSSGGLGEGEGEEPGDDDGAAEEQAEADAEAQEGVAAGYERDGNRRRPKLRLPDDEDALRSFMSLQVSWWAADAMLVCARRRRCHCVHAIGAATAGAWRCRMHSHAAPPFPPFPLLPAAGPPRRTCAARQAGGRLSRLPCCVHLATHGGHLHL